MNTANLTFGKDKTAIVKGFAILFMIILHCGSGQGWYDVSIPAFSMHQGLQNIFGTFKICVGIFTFMVGYGYAFSKNRDFRYSITHIWKMLLPFWIILFVFTLPVIIAKGEWKWGELILNMFGIKSSWCWVSWFVAFYIYALIVMPLVSRVMDKKPILVASIVIVLSYGIEVAVHELISNYSDNAWTQRLFDCMATTPGMILGYLFAYKEWFVKTKIPKHWSMVVMAVGIIIAVFVLRYYVGSVAGFNMDFFYAPLFIFAVLVIFNLYHPLVLTGVFTELGNTSTYMWFFHSLFFTAIVRSVYQPLILLSHSLWIIIPWAVLLTFSCCWALQRLTKALQQKIVKVSCAKPK